jgi:ribose transport system permease protein
MNPDIADEATAEIAAADVRGSAARRFLLSNEFGLVVLIAAFALFFAAFAPGFTSRFSLYALGRTMAIDVMIGFSMLVVIVTGGLNLAVGAIGVSSVMFCGWLIEIVGAPLPLALLGGLAMGAALGWLNGAIITRTGIHSFIITLATMSIFFGMMIFLTRAEAFRALPPEVAAFGKARIAGYVSPLLLISVAAALLLAYLYRQTALGREMLAAGAAPRAAELSGVNVSHVFTLCHMLSGLLAAVAGMMLMARTGAAIPSMAGHLGQDWLLPAFLAPVLGGALLGGGRAPVLGTFLGAMLGTLLGSGLLLLQVGEFWVRAVLGALLLAAVLADKARRTFLARRNMA